MSIKKKANKLMCAISFLCLSFISISMLLSSKQTNVCGKKIVNPIEDVEIIKKIKAANQTATYDSEKLNTLYGVGEANLISPNDIVTVGGIECYVLSVDNDANTAELISKDIYYGEFDDGEDYIYANSSLFDSMDDFYKWILCGNSRIIDHDVTYYYKDFGFDPDDDDFNSYDKNTITEQKAYALDAIDAKTYASKFSKTNNENYGDFSSFWVAAGKKYQGSDIGAYVISQNGFLTSTSLSDTKTGVRPAFTISLELHEHEDTTFGTEIKSDFEGGYLSEGNYYLKWKLTEIEEPIIIPENKTVNICLNGKDIQLFADEMATEAYCALEIKEGATLNIYDCSDNPGSIYVGDGALGYIKCSGNLNIYQGTIWGGNNSGQDFISLNGNLYLGEAAKIQVYGTGNAIFCDADKTLDIHGQVFQNYNGTEKTPAAIVTEKASPTINIYNSTVVKSKKGLDFELNCDHNTVLVVKETLTGSKNFRYHYWSVSADDSEWDAIKLEDENTNSSEEIKSYFTYVSRTGAYFDKLVDRVVKIYEYKAVTQPTEDNAKFETNNEDASYQWYKVNYTKGFITDADLVEQTSIKTLSPYDETGTVLVDAQSGFSNEYQIYDKIVANIKTEFDVVKVYTSKTMQQTGTIMLASYEPFSLRVRTNQGVYYKGADVSSDFAGCYDCGQFDQYDTDNTLFKSVYSMGMNYVYFSFNGTSATDSFVIELVDRLVVARITADDLVDAETHKYEVETLFKNAFDIHFNGNVTLEYETIEEIEAVKDANSKVLSNPAVGSYYCKATWNNNTLCSKVYTLNSIPINTITFKSVPTQYFDDGNTKTLIGTTSFSDDDLEKFDFITSYVLWYENYPDDVYGAAVFRVKEGYSIKLKDGSIQAQTMINGLPEEVTYSYIMVFYGDSALSGYAPGQKDVQVGDYLILWKPLEKVSHHWSEEWTIDVEATCTTDGSKSHHCTDENCTEKTDVTVIPAAHTWSEEWTVDTPATCTTDGSKSHHCSKCTEKNDVTVISAKGHTYGEWIISPATIESDAKRSKECSVCHDTVVEPIEGTKKSESIVDEKADAKVTTPNGFDPDVKVVVEVIVETEVESKISNNTLFNYNTNLNKNEIVGVVFDVKLKKIVDGVETEIQPSDLEGVTSITVYMKLPEDLDIAKITRILHVHGDGTITEYAFDKSKVKDSYYEITIDKLSEFAFIYKNNSLSVGGIICIILVLLFLLLLLIYILGYFFCYRRGHLDDSTIRIIYKFLPRGDYNRENSEE